MKNKWALTGFCLAHVIIIAFLFNSPLYDHRYTASVLYFDYADRTFLGHLPYRDFPVEYPPLALVFFLLPRLFTGNVNTYGYLFTAEIVICDLIGVFLISAVARRFKFSVRDSLGVYTIALLAVGPIVGLRYDLIPAVMTLAALYAFYRGNNRTSWTMLALGTMTKLYPAVVAPLFFIQQIRHRQYRRVIEGCLTFGAVSLLTALPFLVRAPGGFLASFIYHADRGLQMESTYASVLLFLHNLNLIPVYLNFDFGSWNVGGRLADTLSELSTPLVLLGLLVAYLLYARRQSRHTIRPPTDLADFALTVNYSTLAVIVFMAAGKVLSPQFVVWLYPFMPLLAGTWKYPSWALFVAIGLMTYYIFPTHYLEILAFSRTGIDVLLWRNILLIALGLLLMIEPPPRELPAGPGVPDTVGEAQP